MAKRKSDKMAIPVGEAVAMAFGMSSSPPAYQPMPERQGQGPSQRNLIWSDMIANGESSKGFCAQTANGTSYDQGRGWNRTPPYRDTYPAEEGGPWQSGPSNRTGE